MKKLNILILLVAMIAALALTGCEVSVTTANFENLQMASEVDEETYEPITTTDVFGVDSPVFYATGVIANAPEGTIAKAEWYYMNEGEETFIDEALVETVNSTTPVVFSLAAPDMGWPVTEYLVKFYIDGEYQETLEFSVE